MKEVFMDRIIKLDIMKISKPFINCNIREDFQQFAFIIKDMKSYFQNSANGFYDKIDKDEKFFMELALKNIAKEQKQHYASILQRLK